MSAFHWKDSIFFERLPNGDVKLKKTVGGASDQIIFEMEISAAEWCSIVAAVAPGGPKAANFMASRALHLGSAK